MKVAILGYASQGETALEYWSGQDAEITVCDKNENTKVPSGISIQLGEDYLNNLARFDLLVRTPALHPREITKANPEAPNILDKVTTVTNEFFKVCPSRNIIGVTGTKGKGTTSTLIAKMLEAAGKKVHLGGNIGIPPLDLLKNNIQTTDWIVLELANFQLIDLEYSPTIAACLLVVPEHLDWHHEESEYIEAKQQLFRWQKDQDTAIYYALSPTSQHIAGVSAGHKLPYMKHPGADVIDGSVVIDGQTICEANEIQLLGRHNWQNVCAAITVVWQITHDIAAIRDVVTMFTGLEHRLELVRELDGVKYYDDSFGTTPETAIVAIQAFEQPSIIILGGSDKGANYQELAKTIAKSNVNAVILIGKEASKIKTALEAESYKNTISGGETMAEIIKTAKNKALPGDIVLLSPACASFDMFKNYQDRGDQFKQIVKKLN